MFNAEHWAPDISCHLFHIFLSIAPILDDDSTSESSEDSAQAAARAEVQKQRKLKPGTLTKTKQRAQLCTIGSSLYACHIYL